MELCDTVCLSDEVISDAHTNDTPSLVELSDIQLILQVIIHVNDFAYYMHLCELTPQLDL